MSLGVEAQLKGRNVAVARFEQAWMVRASTSFAGAGLAGDEHGHGGCRDAAHGGEERLHFLGDEDRVALVLDRVGRPQRGAAALGLRERARASRAARPMRRMSPRRIAFERVVRRVACESEWFVPEVAQDQSGRFRLCGRSGLSSVDAWRKLAQLNGLS
jgi:hypothetical protein